MTTREINWTDIISKGWHFALILGAAYAATDPRFTWAVPALTAAAGMSKSPLNGNGPK